MRYAVEILVHVMEFMHRLISIGKVLVLYVSTNSKNANCMNNRSNNSRAEPSQPYKYQQVKKKTSRTLHDPAGNA